MHVGLYKQVPKREYETEIDEVVFLNHMLVECHSFLQGWKVMTGDRTEEAADAFIAVTELEKEIRERRNSLAAKLDQDISPF